MKNIKVLYSIAAVCFFWLVSLHSVNAQDLVVLGGFYDQAIYAGYPTKGTYTVQLSKTSSYVFTSGQFEINVSLPPQGSYDPARSSEVILPPGWEMIVNSNQSLILRLVDGAVFSGSGAGINRRRDFFIPIITSAKGSDEPTLSTIQWNDPEVEENPAGNSAGSVLNVLDVPLPVTLVSFSATKESGTAFLKWSTTFETNSDHFEVQRSSNGKNWNQIGIVASNGESTSLKDYSFSDTKPMRAENLYRLKMIDKDQSFAYSRIQGVRFEDTVQDLSVYPNPSADFVYIRDAGNVEEVSVTDLKGNTVYQSGELEKGEINVKNLLAGPYAVKVLRKNGQTTVQKIIVVK